MQRFRHFIILLALVKMSEAPVQAGCRSLDLTSPSSSFSMPDLESREPKCKKTTLGELPAWMQSKVAPNLDHRKRGLFTRILKFTGLLHLFQKKKPNNPCVNGGIFKITASAERFYAKGQNFRDHAKLLLRDNSYRYVEPQKLYQEFQEDITDLKRMDKERDATKNAHLENAITLGRGIKTVATAAAQILSKSDDDHRVASLAAHAINAGLDLAVVRNINSLNFKALLPDNSYKMQWIRSLHGASMIALGATAIALAPFTAGLSSTVISAVSAGISVVAAAAGFNRWTMSNRDRKVIVSGEKTNRGLPIADRYLKATSRVVTEGVHQALELGRVTFFPTVSAKMLTFLPYIGGAVQVAIGADMVYNSFRGYERGHDKLREYEHFYKKVFSNKIDERIGLVGDVMQEGRQLFVKENGSLSSDHLLDTICMCESLAWLEDVKKRGLSRFDRRIAYLDGKLEWQDSRLNPSNWLKSAKALAAHNERMKKYGKAAQNENISIHEALKMAEASVSSEKKKKACYESTLAAVHEEPSSYANMEELKIYNGGPDSPQMSQLKNEARAIDQQNAATLTEIQTASIQYLKLVDSTVKFDADSSARSKGSNSRATGYSDSVNSKSPPSFRNHASTKNSDDINRSEISNPNNSQKFSIQSMANQFSSAASDSTAAELDDDLPNTVVLVDSSIGNPPLQLDPNELLFGGDLSEMAELPEILGEEKLKDQLEGR